MTKISTKVRQLVSGPERTRRQCIRKFQYHFPGGYRGQKFRDWERNYKWEAHLKWEEQLNKKEFSSLLKQGEFALIAKRAISIESKTNLLFSFEKMALRDAVKDDSSAKLFAKGLFDFLHGTKPIKERFENYRDMLAQLPVKQTRVLTWPVLTVFGFIAQPEQHIYLKPTVTKAAAKKYKFDFSYSSKPGWNTYQSLLDFAEQVKKDTSSLGPRDMIDLQSFIWVMGSDEYPD
jgi:hypothetical protein